MDAWIHRLRDAYDAGYYKTEPAPDAQTAFPWQNKTCEDCPFWSFGICQVFAEYRTAESHTCVYFDPWNHEAARGLIQERQQKGIGDWWEWLNDRGATH